MKSSQWEGMRGNQKSSQLIQLIQNSQCAGATVSLTRASAQQGRPTLPFLYPLIVARPAACSKAVARTPTKGTQGSTALSPQLGSAAHLFQLGDLAVPVEAAACSRCRQHITCRPACANPGSHNSRQVFPTVQLGECEVRAASSHLCSPDSARAGQSGEQSPWRTARRSGRRSRRRLQPCARKGGTGQWGNPTPWALGARSRRSSCYQQGLLKPLPGADHCASVPQRVQLAAASPAAELTCSRTRPWQGQVGQPSPRHSPSPSRRRASPEAAPAQHVQAVPRGSSAAGVSWAFCKSCKL